MKRLLRGVVIAGAIVVLLAVVTYAVVYGLSERILHKPYSIPAVSVVIPNDAASIVEGRRLAALRGCIGACHGRDGEGKVMFNDPKIARIIAPNLTAAVRKYSDAQLVVAIRNGVRPDGRSMVAMPSEAFVTLSDSDVGRIVAFLKSLPPVPGPEQGVSVGPLGRIGLATGKFKMVAQLIAETMPPPESTTDQARTGRYLARTTCAACHGGDLRGSSNPTFTSPDLRVVAAYSPDAFKQLMREGVAVGNRTLDVMTEWSKTHLSLLDDAEISALYGYLHALGAAR